MFLSTGNRQRFAGLMQPPPPGEENFGNSGAGSVDIKPAGELVVASTVATQQPSSNDPAKTPPLPPQGAGSVDINPAGESVDASIVATHQPSSDDPAKTPPQPPRQPMLTKAAMKVMPSTMTSLPLPAPGVGPTSGSASSESGGDPTNGTSANSNAG
jgi:hypothetical protein